MFRKPRDGSPRKQLILIANLFQKYTKWSEVYLVFLFLDEFKGFYLYFKKIIFPVSYIHIKYVFAIEQV